MIEITRMDGRIILVNENLIETAEATPDTVIIMANGRKFIVQESLPEIMRRCNERPGYDSSAPLVSTSEEAVRSRINDAIHRG
ncbi:flagellar FlbD family protein [Butyrivibrio sp. LC3010]|uniref:flagellar FlbD family protein n=1 Tax=Butyrivibrio sp. LC3010 TaxID=1280680 RepID=UPI00040C89A7|nr:flagellar FlbD family protein [Butyrivibrio sp. LC3010]